MKKIMQTFALLLAFGASMQVLMSYASEQKEYSPDEEAEKIISLIERRNELNTNDEALNDELVKQTLRYLKSIKAENSLKKMLKKREFLSVDGHGEPGI